MIWRDLLQEDVGVDGSIELVLDDAPTGKLIGVQVKSGSSYIRASDGETFRFYPSSDDLEYWRKLAIPLILVVFDPASSSLHWIDVTKRSKIDSVVHPARHSSPSPMAECWTRNFVLT